MAYPDINEFARLLKKYPPVPKNRIKRREIVEMINPIYRRRDMGLRYEPLNDYYRRCVDKVIREVRRTNVSKGLMAWKLHSSGILLKSPRAVIAIDLIDSVAKANKSNDLLVDPDLWNRPPEETIAGMYMTADQRKALAELIDYSFYTHQHRDHISWDIVRLTIEAGNTVIVTPNIRSAWKDFDFARKLIVLDHIDSRNRAPDLHTLGLLKIRVHQGYQVHNTGNLTQCDSYLITTDNNVNVFVKADTTDTSLYTWLVRQKNFGAKIDLYVGNTTYGQQRMGEVTRLYDCFLLPGHDWDMVHGPSVPGTYWHNVGPWGGVYDQFDWQFVRNRCELVTWGERFHFVPSDDGLSNGLFLATQPGEVAGFNIDDTEGYFGKDIDFDSDTNSQWSWNGRTIKVHPPCKPKARASVFAVYPVDLNTMGSKPVLKIGMATDGRQERYASKSFVLRVKISQGWGKPATVVRREEYDLTEPKYICVSLAEWAGKNIHVILEVDGKGAKTPPAVWLLNPYIA